MSKNPKFLILDVQVLGKIQEDMRDKHSDIVYMRIQSDLYRKRLCV